MSSYTTPAFQWSLPDQNLDSQKPSPAKSQKPIANPLLKQSFSPNLAAATRDRLPFSPVENQTLRQRRQPPLQQAGVPNVAGTKRPVRPPTKSFLVNGDVGIVPNQDVRQTTTTDSLTTLPTLMNDSLDRWVVVYGYSTEAQYNAILRKFSSFGKVVSHRGSCKPGRSNWIALEYESVVQAEKALCQQNCILTDGILVGVVRLTVPLQQSLDWNASTTSSLVLSSTNVVASRLEPKFDQDEMTETDILVVESPKKKQPIEIAGAKGNVCERFLAWWFAWA